MGYEVKIEAFEGPLDLLLHLINRLEIDIYDIQMAEISEQYSLYVHAMSELRLDVASEYLVMAATLLAIKSKMLLPKYDEEVDEVQFEEDDPRDELVERLIEYKQFKEAASALKEMESERGEIYMKPPSDLSAYAEQTKQEASDIGATIFDMLGAYHKLLRRKKLKRPVATKISHKEISIEARMAEVLNDLTKSKKRISFFVFFQSNDKQYIVATFLAMLELMKRKEVIVEQEGNFDEIYLTARKEAL